MSTPSLLTSPKDNAPSARFAKAWTAGWVVFLAAFMGVGALEIRSLWDRVPAVSQGSRNSTDTVLLVQTGTAHASARIAACLLHVPPQAPVAIVYADPMRTRQAVLQFCTLTWPRPAHLIELTPGELPDIEKLEGKGAPAAIFFVGMPPPAALEGIHSLSPLLHFYPIHPHPAHPEVDHKQ